MNTPITSNSPEPKFPIWPVVALIVFLAVTIPLWIANFLVSLIPAFSAFLTVSLAHVIAGYLLVRASDTRQKAIKSLFDLSWNIWTAVGLAFTVAVVTSGHGDLYATMREMPVTLTILLVWASFTAVGRVLISLIDVWTTWKAPRVQGLVVSRKG